jgi:hypothetical protein
MCNSPTCSRKKTIKTLTFHIYYQVSAFAEGLVVGVVNATGCEAPHQGSNPGGSIEACLQFEVEQVEDYLLPLNYLKKSFYHCFPLLQSHIYYVVNMLHLQPSL